MGKTLHRLPCNRFMVMYQRILAHHNRFTLRYQDRQPPIMLPNKIVIQPHNHNMIHKLIKTLTKTLTKTPHNITHLGIINLSKKNMPGK